jgi:hypothetical protein
MALVSTARYRERTGDEDSSDATVTANLARAVAAVEEFLRRGLIQESRTEAVTLDGTGLHQVRAWPIVSVSDPAQAEVLFGQLIRTAHYADPWFGELPTVTYVGGYADGALPPTLEGAVIDLAHAYLPQGDEVGVAASLRELVAAGVTGQVRVGDVTLTMPAVAPDSHLDQLVGGICARLSPWRRR